MAAAMFLPVEPPKPGIRAEGSRARMNKLTLNFAAERALLR